MLTDNGLPHFLTTSQCARLKQYTAAVRADMVALLVECRAAWERDVARAEKRGGEVDEAETEEEATE
jgi:hypothetical protein